VGIQVDVGEVDALDGDVLGCFVAERDGGERP